MINLQLLQYCFKSKLSSELFIIPKPSWVGVGAGNLGVIVVRVFEPVFRNLPQSYTWPLKKRTHSYIRSSEMLTHSYTAL